MINGKIFENKLSATWTSLSLLQVLTLLIIAVFSLSLFLPAYDSVADKGEDSANIALGISIIAGGVGFLVTAPVAVGVSAVVGLGALSYYTGYKIMDAILESSS